VLPPDPFAVNQGVSKDRGDTRLSQPPRTGFGTIQLPIQEQESPARMWIGQEQLGLGLRKSTRQSPGNEDDGILGDPMREPSLLVHNFNKAGGETAGATRKCPDPGFFSQNVEIPGRLLNLHYFNGSSMGRIRRKQVWHSPIESNQPSPFLNRQSQQQD